MELDSCAAVWTITPTQKTTTAESRHILSVLLSLDAYTMQLTEQDSELARELVGEVTGAEYTEPSSELKNGYEPSLLATVRYSITHLGDEVVHGQNTGEYTLTAVSTLVRRIGGSSMRTWL